MKDSSSAVHDVYSFQHIGECLTEKLLSLIGIKNIRLVVFTQDLLQTIDTKYHLYGVADSPAERSTRVPINTRPKLGKTTLQTICLIIDLA